MAKGEYGLSGEASYEFATGCTDATGYCVLPNNFVFTTLLDSETTSGTVTVNAENASGTWTDTVSADAYLSEEFQPSWTFSGYSVAYSGYQSLSHTWTVPLQTVLDIPAAGDYIVDLDVTGISGTCRLVVLQP